MRWVAVGLIPLLMAGCGAKYRSEGPVMTSYERAVKFPVHRPHDGLVYSGATPATPAPIIPLMAFGAAFDIDVALMPRDGEFDMVEFARLNMPDRHLWLALETAVSGEQTLVANVDDIDAIMPELPLRRVAVDNFTATDLSTEEQINLTVSYDNSRGSRVDAQIEGDPPIRVEKFRNGRTFNHSENQLLAVLDIASQESLFKADVTVDGKGMALRKIGGFVPGRFVQTQTQGGLAVGNFQVVPGGSALGGPGADDVMVKAPGMGGPAEPVQMDPETMVKMGLASNFSTIKGCYLTRVEEEGADISGGATLSFDVAGGVVTSTLLSSTEISDDALQSCIKQAVEGWVFDSTITGSVNQPVTFVMGGDDSDADVEIGTVEITLEADDEGALVEEAAPEEAMEEEPTKTFTRGAPEGAMAVPLSSFKTVHRQNDGKEITLEWLVTQHGDRVRAVQATPLRTLTYDFRLVSDNYLELVEIQVEQYGRATPVTAITFNPPIPDVRWAFNGRRTSDMVIDVNGQQSFGYGQVDAFWTESGPKLKVTPMEPKWTENRIMQSSILFQADGVANIAIERIGE